MNLFNGDGSYYKIPVAFGLQAFTWSSAQIFDRYGRGQLTAGEAFYHGLINFSRQVLPDSFPAYTVTEDPTAWLFQTFTPQAIRPFMDVAVNKNHWGGELNYGNRTPGLRDFEKGRLNTPPGWHEGARWLHDNAGFNTTPESLRHVVEYYAYGPMQGILSAVTGSRWYEPEYQSTRDTLGPWVSAFGTSMLYGAPQNVPQTVFFREKGRIEDELTARGVRTTDPDNKPGEKNAFVRRQMTEGGFDAADIEKYIRILDAEKNINKINSNLKEQFNGLKGADYDATTISQWFKDAERKKQGFYESVLEKGL
jgi:hypothetical protein